MTTFFTKEKKREGTRTHFMLSMLDIDALLALLSFPALLGAGAGRHAKQPDPAAGTADREL